MVRLHHTNFELVPAYLKNNLGLHNLRHSPWASAACSVCPVLIPLPPELTQSVQSLEDGFPESNLLGVILG